MSKGKLARRSKSSYTLADIERAYRSKELLYIYAMQGDMDSINLLVDTQIAVSKSGATQLQLDTVDIVWSKGFSLVETGKMLEVSPQAVKFNLNLFKVKVKRVLDLWELIERGDAENDSNRS